MIILYNMINLSFVTVFKLTQFCKEIKQQKLQSKLNKSAVNYMLSRLTILGAIHSSMEKTQNRSSIKPENPLLCFLKNLSFFEP